MQERGLTKHFSFPPLHAQGCFCLGDGWFRGGPQRQSSRLLAREQRPISTRSIRTQGLLLLSFLLMEGIRVQKTPRLEVLTVSGCFSGVGLFVCLLLGMVGHGRQDPGCAARKASVLPGSVRCHIPIPSPSPHRQWGLTGF